MHTAFEQSHFKDYHLWQIESGAQVLQIFESWAHHMSEEQFVEFAKVETIL